MDLNSHSCCGGAALSCAAHYIAHLVCRSCTRPQRCGRLVPRVRAGLPPLRGGLLLAPTACLRAVHVIDTAVGSMAQALSTALHWRGVMPIALSSRRMDLCSPSPSLPGARVFHATPMLQRSSAGGYVPCHCAPLRPLSLSRRAGFELVAVLPRRSETAVGGYAVTAVAGQSPAQLEHAPQRTWHEVPLDVCGRRRRGEARRRRQTLRQ